MDSTTAHHWSTAAALVLGGAALYFHVRGARQKKAISYVSTDKAPAAVGPYSQAVKANGMVYVSGCVALHPSEKRLIGETAAEQTRQALTNMKAVVTAAGASMADVVKCTVLLTDMSVFSEVNKVYAEFFSEGKPARACFAVKALPLNALVEIEAIAVDPSS